MLLYICQRWHALIICLVISVVVLDVYGWFKSGNASDSQTQTIVGENVWSSLRGADGSFN